MKKPFLLFFYCTCLILFTVNDLQAQAVQQLAFPGAEGFGRLTSGGRAGVVYQVTNINDSGPGSLREGINMTGARTIVFRTSGTIHLESELKIRNGNLTIAGQTAPGDGIAIKGSGVVVDADNIIIRYIRFRPGDISGGEPDAIWGRNQKDIIIDHCSMSWAVDEASSFYDNENFTMQWCLLSESLYESQHEKGRHGYGGIWGGQGASFHHNILAHHSSRNPRFNGSRYSGEPDLEIVDYRNNVIYNWGGNSAYGGEDGNHNMVANYYKAGPATSGDKRFRILDASTVNDSDPVLGRWHVEDNYVDEFPQVTADNWNGGVQGLNAEQLAEVRYSDPFSFAPVTTQTARDAFISVLEKAGATLPKRDPVDARIVEEIESGTVNYGGAYGEMKGIIDSQEQVGGWPELFSTPAPEDDDHDGMPDAWELEKGLNPDDPEDGKLISESGYTNLENYLNSLVGSSENLLKYPTNLLVEGKSSSSIHLSWENNEERDHTLVLERSSDGMHFVLKASLPTGTTTFTDEELDAGQEYFYRLRVEDEFRSYVFSEIESAFTFSLPAKAVEPAPGDNEIGLDPDLVNFSWNADAHVYRFYFGVSADDLKLVADNLSTPSHQIPDLSGATPYYWRIDGVSENDEVVLGDVWTFTTDEITAVEISSENGNSFKILPNPFSDQLVLAFELKQAETVEILLYDMHQRLICTVVDASFSAAAHEIHLNQEVLANLSSGIYFCVFKTSNNIKKVERVIYIK